MAACFGCDAYMRILTPRSSARFMAHFRSGNLYEPSSPAITRISFWAESMSCFTCFRKSSSVGLGFIFLTTMASAQRSIDGWYVCRIFKTWLGRSGVKVRRNHELDTLLI